MVVLTTLYDFIYRVDNAKVGKKVIEQLILAGCFDFTSWSRKTLVASLESMYDQVIKKRVEKARGVLDLFSQDPNEKNPFENPVAALDEFSETQKLFKEKELLGFFVSGHPLEHYTDQIAQLKAEGLDVIDKQKDGVYKVVFIIESLTVRISNRTNKKWALMGISDGTTSFEVPVWPDMYEKISDIIEENKVVGAVLQVQTNDELLKIQCKWISPIDEVTKQMVNEMQKSFKRSKSWIQRDKSINQEGAKLTSKQNIEPFVLKCDMDTITLNNILELKKIFKQHPGFRSVIVQMQREQETIATLELGQNLSIDDDDALNQKLKEIILTF